MRIRPAVEADLETLVELEREGLGRDAWGPALLAPGVRGEVPTVSYLVAEDGGEVVGYAVLSLTGDDAELQRIAVAARRRRAGTATRLLDELLTAAAAAGAGRLLLEVREDNDVARAFYEARGFTELGRRPRYYRDGAAAVVMSLKAPSRPPQST